MSYTPLEEAEQDRSPEDSQGYPWDNRDTVRREQGDSPPTTSRREKSSNRHRGERPARLPSLETTFRVEEARPALVATPPPRPGQQQVRAARWRPEQVSEQMTHFGNGERKQGTGRRSLIRDRLSGGQASHCANTCKAGLNDHDECHVPIPSRPTAHFVISQAHVFPCLKILFNV